jgi:G3E family GTPase
MSKSPIYLITGYLGSGKTTFIRQIIETYTGEKKIAVIQNEFAPANVDGIDLKRQTNKYFELLEINNGSVFCVCLLSGFVNSLKAFVNEHKPGFILMEASGLSDPVSIGQIFGSPELQDEVFLAGVICIVDAANFIKMNSMMHQIGHQLMIADEILINKTDLYHDLEEIKTAINKINPLARKHFTIQSNTPYNSIFQTTFNTDQKTQKRYFFLQGDSNRPDIQSVVLRTSKPMKSKNLQSFLKTISENCYRLKGTIILDNGKVFSVQLVAADYKFEEIVPSSKQTELIAIGKEISPRYLKTAYDEASRA